MEEGKTVVGTVVDDVDADGVSRSQRIARRSITDGEAAGMRLLRSEKEGGAAYCSTRQIFGGALGFVLCLSLSLVPLSEEYPYAGSMLALTCLISSFWVFEVLPLPIVSLFPVILFPCFGVMSSSDASKSYGHWLIMLFVGAFIVDGAIVHVNLHTRVALGALVKVGVKRPWLVLATFMGLAWVLSMFCLSRRSAACLPSLSLPRLAGEWSCA